MEAIKLKYGEDSIEFSFSLIHLARSHELEG
jgi:hypothetical protein